MMKRLLGTTALVAAFVGVNWIEANDAQAQKFNCPASSLQGTGNVSNALCNWAGTPVPFTLTFQFNGDFAVGTQMGEAEQQPGAGHNDIGFIEQAWTRAQFDAAGPDNWHYGFHFRLLLISGVAVRKNNVSHSPSQIDREWLYVRNPVYGTLSLGQAGSAIPFFMPMTLGQGSPGWGPSPVAPQNIGPDNGFESIFINDPTAAFIDGAISPVGGADLYRMKSATKVYWLGPQWFGSDDDHGWEVGISYAPDGSKNNEGNFVTQNNCISGGAPGLGVSCQASGPLLTVGSQISTPGSDYKNLSEGGVWWDDFIGGPDFEWGWAAGYTYGQHRPNEHLQDLFSIGTGANLTYKENFVVGVDYSNGFHSMYATKNIPAKMPNSEGWSTGFMYDFDRYRVGFYWQHAKGQGDFTVGGSTAAGAIPDRGSITLNYFNFGGSVNILKGLKLYNEEIVYNDTDNHSAADLAADGFRRHSSGVIVVFGMGLNF